MKEFILLYSNLLGFFFLFKGISDVPRRWSFVDKTNYKKFLCISIQELRIRLFPVDVKIYNESLVTLFHKNLLI